MSIKDILIAVWNDLKAFFPAFTPLVGISIGLAFISFIARLVHKIFLGDDERFTRIEDPTTSEPQPIGLSSSYYDWDDIDPDDWHRCLFCNMPIDSRVCPHCGGYSGR